MNAPALPPDAAVADLEARLRELAERYPPAFREEQRRDVPRIAFHVRLVLGAVGPRARVADVGGGIGLFSPGCAAAGMSVMLIDDFEDPVNREAGASVLDLHRSLGIEVVARDVARDGLPEIAPGSLDALTSFDSLEHWHGSPRAALHAGMRALRPGGLLLLGLPNCVNLRKRLTVPLGRGAWSSFDSWYGEDVFRGHVREPDVADLQRIAADLGIVGPRILGRNWLGCNNARPAVRWGARLVDPILRIRPSLCSDLYLVGFKPGDTAPGTASSRVRG